MINSLKQAIDITQAWWRNLAINASILPPFFQENPPNFAKSIVTEAEDCYKADERSCTSSTVSESNAVANSDFEDYSVLTWLNANNHLPLKNFRQQTLTFVPQDSLPPNTAYEQFIAEEGNICTRDNLHDLFNGIIWLNFPKTKAVLNQLHMLDIANNGIQQQRSALRHALTLFDENGGIVVSSEFDTLQALQAFDWQTALYTHREQWQNFEVNSLTKTQFFAFGHALLEKLAFPRKNICSHTLLLQVNKDWFSQTVTEQRSYLDNFLSQWLLSLTLIEGKLHPNSTKTFNSKMFQPLPVLGIPHFANHQTLDFYQDTSIFRPPRVGIQAKIFTI